MAPAAPLPRCRRCGETLRLDQPGSLIRCLACGAMAFASDLDWR